MLPNDGLLTETLGGGGRGQLEAAELERGELAVLVRARGREVVVGGREAARAALQNGAAEQSPAQSGR